MATSSRGHHRPWNLDWETLINTMSRYWPMSTTRRSERTQQATKDLNSNFLSMPFRSSFMVHRSRSNGDVAICISLNASLISSWSLPSAIRSWSKMVDCNWGDEEENRFGRTRDVHRFLNSKWSFVSRASTNADEVGASWLLCGLLKLPRELMTVTTMITKVRTGK